MITTPSPPVDPSVDEEHLVHPPSHFSDDDDENNYDSDEHESVPTVRE